MAEKIVINPVTRVSGFLDIEATIENHTVVDAKTRGLMFRGFEKMLTGRSPLDAVYFTERICGICSTAHSVAASMALESSLSYIIKEQGRYLRDILHGCEFLQNHIRHFYQFTIPDFVKFPDSYPYLKADHNDFRLPKEANDRMVNNYFISLELSKNAHKMLAVLGGKAPHNHGAFIGGIASPVNDDMVIKIASILEEIQQFVDDRMIPDVYEIADYYHDYFHNGKGYGNFLTYGSFYGYPSLGTLYVDPLIYNGVQILPFQRARITVSTDHSYFSNAEDSDTQPIPDIYKPGAYSWVKTVRYNGEPYEVGPLARQWLSGEYRKGISTMDRTIARVLETKKVVNIMKILLKNLIPDVFLQEKYSIPAQAEGQGLIDTTRGALGHWIGINDSKISYYQIITPSMWNLSPMGNDNIIGVAENALVGTWINDVNHPVEIGRIIRSFDPCVSCAAHIFRGSQLINTIKIMV